MSSDPRKDNGILSGGGLDYRIVFNAVANGMALTEAGSGRIIDVNAAWIRSTGMDRGKSVGRTAFELGIWNHRDEREACMVELEKKGRLVDFEVTLRMNSTEIPHLISAEFVDIGGKRYILWEIRDISSQKQMNEALRKSNERFHHLASNVPAYFAYVNADTLAYEYVNIAFEKSFGIPQEKIIGSHIKDIIGDANYQFALKYIDEVRSGKSISYENTFTLASGKRWIQVNYTPITDLGGRVTSIAVMSYDITEFKQTEEALKKSEEKYRSIVETTSEWIWEIDVHGKHTYTNQFVEKILGYSVAEFLESNTMDLLSDEDRAVIQRKLPELVALKKGWNAWSIQWRHKNGSYRLLESNAEPILDSNGQVIGYRGADRDITERKRIESENQKLQDQLAQAQKLESVGRLAGGVAHDFNNMLSVIIGRAELALMKLQPSDAIYKDLREIEKVGKRSADLTRQLLAFARKQTIAPRILNLNDTIESMLKMLRQLIGEDITLLWKPAANLWMVKIDPAQIDQILANLVVNARDAIHDIGKVIIATENATLDAENCAAHPGFTPGQYALLVVGDNGCGMDQATLRNIFEPFFTTKPVGHGTGLGLATVYGIVKQNNGFIHVHSEPGEGTTFKIYLPRYVGKTIVASTKASLETTTGGPETILLVEDEPSILEVAKIMLEKLGYRMLTAVTPGEAICLAEEHAGEIHLLMTDVIMPEMNGRDLAKRMLALYPNIKRLFMSGYTADIIAHHGVLEEGVHFIQKPFTIKDLADKVRAALDRSNHGPRTCL